MRDVLATFEGPTLRLEHRIRGDLRGTLTLPSEGIELAGFAWRRPDRMRGNGPIEIRTLDLLGLDVVTVTTHLRHDRLQVWGESEDVRVVHQGSELHPEGLDIWVDGTGRVLRQELGSPALVALWAPPEEVAAHGRGEAVERPADLNLTFVSSEYGLSMERPDPSWDLEVGRAERALIVSFLQPKLRATVDVFRLPGVTHTTSLEGVAVRAQDQMRARSTGFSAAALRAVDVGGRPALEFDARARRGDQDLTSRALVLREGGSAFLVICAAPTEHYPAATASFDRILQSLRWPRPANPGEGPAERAFAELTSEGQ